MDSNEFTLPENSKTGSNSEEAVGLKEGSQAATAFKCQITYGGPCGTGFGVDTNIVNTDTSKNYNVTLQSYTNGNLMQQRVVGVPAGGTSPLGCSQAQNSGNTYNYTYTIVGEVAY